jgi:prefoldin subunit 5
VYCRCHPAQELVKVVGNGAAAALDAQCSYLQAEITQQDQSLAEKQDSLAMLEDLHARAMQRKETQVSQGAVPVT